MEFLV